MRRRLLGRFVAVLTVAAVLGGCRAPAAPSDDSTIGAPRSAAREVRPTGTEPAPPRLPPGEVPQPLASATEAREPPGPVIDVADAGAAGVAFRYAEAAWTVLPGDGPASWFARVAPLTTPEHQASLEGGGAGGASSAQLIPGTPRVTTVASLTAGDTRWRFQVSVVVTATAPGGAPLRGVSMILDVADTPAGPKVAGAR